MKHLLVALEALTRERDEARDALREAWEVLPNYGSEGCLCGNMATPYRECPLHAVAWVLESRGFDYHSAALADGETVNHQPEGHTA